MALHDEQLERETQSVTRGIARVQKALDKDRTAGREFDNPATQAMMTRLMVRAVESVRNLQTHAKAVKVEKALTVGTRLADWELPILLLDADELAYITLRTMLNSTGLEKTDSNIASTIGKTCYLQFQWHQANVAEREGVKDGNHPYNRLTKLRQAVKRINPKHVRKWMRKIEFLTEEPWSNEVCIKLGLQLVEAVFVECPDIFERCELHKSIRGKRNTVIQLRLTPKAQEYIGNKTKELGMASPWHIPMIHKPSPWTPEEAGGYLDTPQPIVKPNRGRPYEGEVPEVVYDALNRIQDTGWRINGRMLGIAQKAWDDRVAAVLPVRPTEDLLPKVDPEIWKEMSEDERRVIKSQRREIHDSNNRLENKRNVQERQLQVAHECGDRTIYFPHNMDFRGRMYPIPQDLHPQSDDFGKSLLRFSEAKPLGQHGFRWLQYHTASKYGLDKSTRDEQLDWCRDHLLEMTKLVEAAFHPDSLKFWASADDPWQFLAAATELVAAYRHGADDHMSALPISVDGSCNGLQHLSAMGRDPEGALATNLTSCVERQDIYQIVADKVDDLVIQDTEEREPMEACINWLGKVTRKVVKRAVMTIPYGLTFAGMKDQLMDDRHKCWPDVPGMAHTNATYIRGHLNESIKETVSSATAIMSWMQANAKALARQGKGVSWTAPTGFPVHQFYAKRVPKMLTVIGPTPQSRRHERRIHNYDQSNIDVSRQGLGIAPNIIHSFDAAHMALSVAHAPEDLSFAAIHDSFGCHACDMDVFLGVIKEAFVEIYEHDWLELLAMDFFSSGDAEKIITDPPDLGEFDVNQVTLSDFFFA